MFLEELIAVVLIALLGMLSPGPNFCLISRNALYCSRKVALASSLGINVGIAVHLLCCILGLSSIIQNTQWLFLSIKYFGAAYLIFLGIESFRNKEQVACESDKKCLINMSPMKGFLQGFLCSLLNITTALFFLSVFSHIINVETGIGERVIYGAVIIILELLYWPMMVLLIQHKNLKQFLQGAQQKINKILGGALVIFGIKMALTL